MGAVCCKSCRNYNSNKGFNVNNEIRQSQRNNQSPHRSSLITSSNSQISTIQSAMEMSNYYITNLIFWMFFHYTKAFDIRYQ